MKKSLNEEIHRIKFMMGCCKGMLNEAESDCVNLDSPQGIKMVNEAAAKIATEVNSLGLTNDDVSNVNETNPEVEETKKKIGEMMNPFIKDASKDDIKFMIKQIKDLRRSKRKEKQEPTQTQKPPQSDVVNEQVTVGQLQSIWPTKILPFLSSIPTGVFIIVGAWLILRLLRCYIYKMEISLLNCGANFQNNIFIKLTELVFLDFSNLFASGGDLYNCGFLFND